MDYNTSNVSQYYQTVFIKLYKPNSGDIFDLLNHPSKEAENFGGHYFFNVNNSGTSASGTSLTTVQTEFISYLQYDGPIPSYTFQQNQTARNLEQIVNPNSLKEDLAKAF